MNSGDGVMLGSFVASVDTDVGVSSGIAVPMVPVATTLVRCGVELDSLSWGRGRLHGAIVAIVTADSTTCEIVVEDGLGHGEIAVRGVLRLASAKPSKAVRVASASIFVS